MKILHQRRKSSQLIYQPSQQFSTGGGGGRASTMKKVLMAVPLVASLPFYYIYLNEGGEKQQDKEGGAKVPASMPASVDQSKNYFTTGVCMIPHEEKAHKGGEDAFSCSSNACMICVADGVGGWAKKGVDPGLYSRELCHQFREMYETKDGDEKNNQKQNLVEATKMAMKKHIGTSTFVSMIIHKDKASVEGLNLGDSGYVIYHGGQVTFHSPVQQWRFNAPYQCGTNHKLPYNAQSFQHKVENGDLIIMASDGLWDNLDDKQIVESVKNCKSTTEMKLGEVHVGYPVKDETQELSKCIAHQAHFYSLQKGYESPFAKGAKEHGKFYMGGKEDDITVMVSKINIQSKQA